MLHRRDFSIGLRNLFSRVSMFEDIEAFGKSRHYAVFDAIVYHLHEVSGARRPAMQVALFSRAGGVLPARGSRKLGAPRRQRFEDRSEILDHFGCAADHLAIASLQPPHSAAGPDIHVVEPESLEFRG